MLPSERRAPGTNIDKFIDVLLLCRTVIQMLPNHDFVSGTLRPVWRGRLHAMCAVIAVPAGAVLVSATDGAAAKLSVGAFAVAMFMVYAVSGSYHQLARTQRLQSFMRRLDHSMIYVLIAGTYTPICAIAMPRPSGLVLLAGVWAAALCGSMLALIWRAGKFRSALYIGLGWFATVAWPLGVSMPGTAILLVALGGISYTVGAVMFMMRWPRLSPARFGYHEVWHVFTVAGGAAHFVAIAQLVAVW